MKYRRRKVIAMPDFQRKDQRWDRFVDGKILGRNVANVGFKKWSITSSVIYWKKCTVEMLQGSVRKRRDLAYLLAAFIINIVLIALLEIWNQWNSFDP